MGENSAIEWTHHTFNPWRGCTKVSPGCANCYAEQLSKRNPSVLGIWGPNGMRVVASESMWRQPIKWNDEARKAGERRRVFCASLADVFEERPELVAPRHRMLDLVRRTKHLDWLLLTKRPENAIPMLRDFSKGRMGIWSAFHLFMEHELPNVWLGTSVENQEQADKRIPELLKVPTAIRFLSCEPLLGPLDIRRYLPWVCPPFDEIDEDPRQVGYPSIPNDLNLIRWVIVGGESGPNARPMHPDWARSLRDQCKAAGVAFHFKQWGEYAPSEVVDAQHPDDPWYCDRNFYKPRSYGRDDPARVRFFDGKGRLVADPSDGCTDTGKVTMLRVGKKAAGRLLDGVEHNGFPVGVIA